MSYAAVPHSGNRCSGLCETPCKHDDCWQCNEVKAKAERKLHTGSDCNDKCRTPCPDPDCKHCFNTVHKEQMRKQRETDLAAYKARVESIMKGVPAQGPGDTQKTIITRVALENLCKRAGITMDWNNGDPILRDERGWKSATSWSSDSLTPAQIKAKTFEEQVRIISESTLAEDLQRSVDHVLKAKAKQLEEEARQRLRDEGASEADIEAAVTLMGWKPEKKEG